MGITATNNPYPDSPDPTPEKLDKGGYAGTAQTLFEAIQDKLLGTKMIKGVTLTSAIPATGNISAIVAASGTYTQWNNLVNPANTISVLTRIDGVYAISSTGFDFSSYQTKVNAVKNNNFVFSSNDFIDFNTVARTVAIPASALILIDSDYYPKTDRTARTVNFPTSYSYQNHLFFNTVTEAYVILNYTTLNTNKTIYTNLNNWVLIASVWYDPSTLKFKIDANFKFKINGSLDVNLKTELTKFSDFVFASNDYVNFNTVSRTVTIPAFSYLLIDSDYYPKTNRTARTVNFPVSYTYQNHLFFNTVTEAYVILNYTTLNNDKTIYNNYNNWRLIASIWYDPVTLKFKIDANFKFKVNGLFEGQSSGSYQPYVSGQIHFNVSVNQNFQNYTSTTNTVNDSETFANVPSVLMLPTSYLSSGKKVKLVMKCHGAGDTVTDTTWGSASGQTWIDSNNALLNAGYAIFDVNGSNATYGQGLGSSRVMEAYRKAYDYIITNYNVESLIYVHGTSMGGLSALNFSVANQSIVKCIGLFAPVTDLYNQAFLNPWYPVGNAMDTKAAIAREYNFADTSGATWEADKVVGYNPFKNSSVNDTDGVKIMLPIPIKIWHGNSDTSVSYLNSVSFINAVRLSGGKAFMRVVAGQGHSIAAGSAVINSEEVIWFNRF